MVFSRTAQSPSRPQMPAKTLPNAPRCTSRAHLCRKLRRRAGFLRFP
jgi:hypothetical protein